MKVILVSIKPFLKGSESLPIVVLVLPRYLHLSLVDHGLIKAVATHWTGCYSTPAITAFHVGVHYRAREDLLVVGLDDRAYVRGCYVGYFQLPRNEWEIQPEISIQ